MNQERRQLIHDRRVELQAIPGSRFTPEHQAAAQAIIDKYKAKGLK